MIEKKFVLPDYTKMGYDPEVLEYLKDTVDPHRQMVYKLCCLVGISNLGAVHDLSKYGPDEAIYYCTRWHNKDGEEGLSDAARKEFNDAVIHHIKNNPHHLTYWSDDYELFPQALDDKGFLSKVRDVADDEYSLKHAKKIPLNYFMEMICDWIASGIIHCENEGKKWSPQELQDYWTNNDSNLTIHPDTRKSIAAIIQKLCDEGLDALTRENLLKAYNIKDFRTRIGDLFRR